jgi:hypothetical protein
MEKKALETVNRRAKNKTPFFSVTLYHTYFSRGCFFIVVHHYSNGLALF